MTRKAKFLMTSLCIALFALWWGVPTFNKWKADKLVDELCAKDGGIKVYETVSLPKERFNKYGDFLVRGQRVMLPGDEYFTTWEITNIVGSSGSSNLSSLTIFRNHFSIYRTVDNKLLGEAIGYARRGGDPISYLHPSAYICPTNIDNNLTKQVFRKSSN